MNRKAEILYRLGEPLAAGMFEHENSSVVERFGLGLRRYFEHAAPPPESGRLYPAPEHDIWNLAGRFVRFHYSFSLGCDGDGLRRLGRERLADPFERNLLDRVIDELDYFRSDLIPPRYRIGGNGWTHCVLNYRRILGEGLGGYRKRVNAMPPSPLRRALSDTLAGITDFLRRAPGDIAACAEHPARDFRSAMRSFNFFFALDCYDSAGRFDDYMGEFYNGEPDAQMWLEELYRAVDLHDGWHFLHTAKHPAFTRLCLRAQKLRRPNSGLLAGPETPPEIWEELFDVWGRSVPCPSVYNEAAYRSGIRHGSDAKGADRDRFAFGGCTELMFEGCSNIGSTEGGLNLLDILNNSTPSRFRADIRLRMEEFASAVRANSEFAAQYRPQLIRTLFVDDCIDRNREFNAGGARYYGSIVNVAGLTDAANSLAAMRGIPEKFGNDSPEVDEIARKLAHHVFSLIRRYPMRQGGPAYPAVILLTGYAWHGSYVDASADGRPAGAPVVDSAGAVAGTDRNGPTALLNSVAKLPSRLGIGTLVLNVRLHRSLAASRTKRKLLKALLRGFFEQGGLQLQPTLIDQETLKKAYENPAAHPELIVRIGGYSEYYNRLSRELQFEVLKRTEHMI